MTPSSAGLDPQPDVLLEAAGLVKQFPGVRAVDGIRFAVRRGQCFGLLGPNGAGKTTTLEMLEGIQQPTAGHVLYRGRPLDEVYRQQVGIQFQATALQDFQTVAESLTMFASLYSRRADRDELIRLCNLAEILYRDTRKLSGGQRQRLFIARELFRKPNLLILDEATSALDTESERFIQRSIDALKGETTVVIIAHRLSTIRNVDRVYVFDHGRLVEEGAYEELRDAHQSRFGRLVAMQAL